ncbi:MAG: hypothetical protein ACK5SI_13980, partial [Planctomycetia bacterium]
AGRLFYSESGWFKDLSSQEGAAEVHVGELFRRTGSSVSLLEVAFPVRSADGVRLGAIRALLNAVDLYTGLDAADATLGAMLRLRLGVFQDFVGQGEIWEAAKVVLAVLGELFLAVVPSFARFDGVTSLATGMRIGTGNLVECLLRLGLVAPLAIGGLGWALFERRDLVRSNS